MIRPNRYLVVATCLLAMASCPPLASPESPPSPTPAPIPAGCTSEPIVTVPAPVDTAQVLRDVYALEDNHRETLLHWPNARLDGAMAALFDVSAPKSKLEQFYTMLYYISQDASVPGEEITFNLSTAQALLLSSKVFSDPEFPRQITRIHLTRKDRARPRYRVEFEKPEVWLPLNRGLGFGVFREGMCQHAKALVFYGSFSFSLAMKDKRLEVYDFDNVDLWGTFGVRGIVDLDLNYVSVRSVDFLSGNAKGLVRAKVSRKEFEANQHSLLLKLITLFVTDKSLQAIDW